MILALLETRCNYLNHKMLSLLKLLKPYQLEFAGCRFTRKYNYERDSMLQSNFISIEALLTSKSAECMNV